MANIINKVDYLVLGTDESDSIDVQNNDFSPTSVYGGLGNDIYYIDARQLDAAFNILVDQDHIVEAAGGGVDTVNVDLVLQAIGGSQGYTLDDNVENLNATAFTDVGFYTFSLVGNASANVMTAIRGGYPGNASFDMRGGAGNDKLVSSIYDDTLDGGTGNDTLVGGAGSDAYYVDSALDVIVENVDGGYDDVLTSATYTLSANIESLSMAAGYNNINATGNALGNRLFGNSGNNILSGLDGNDMLNGQDGNDTLLGGNGNDALNGENFNDNLQGGAGADTLDGGNGADIMDGGAGDDTYFIDALDTVKDTGVGGNDTVYVYEQLAGDLAIGIENLIIQGAGAFNGRGNALNNAIAGNASNNQLFGLAGNDNLTGNDGDDLLDGGDGNDTLNGGAGNDLMLGGAGNDVYFVNAAGDAAVEVSASGGVDLIVSSSFSVVMGDFIENLVLSAGAYAAQGNTLNNVMTGSDAGNNMHGAAGNDRIEGKGGNDSLHGDDGNDTLIGGAGDDALYGGNGADLYIVDDLTDQVYEFGAANEIDTVQSSVTFSLNNYSVQLVENLTLVGSANINGIGNVQNNIIKGNDGRNVLSGYGGNDTLIGGLGVDTLDGGTGNDSMTGGAGSDSYYVDSTADKVIELANQGSDAIYTTVSISLANFANVENLVFTGAGNLNTSGNALDNIIEGNLGNDTIDGGAGNDGLFGKGGDDLIKGGAGDDRLEGGSGNDTMIGGAGDDSYVLRDAGDVIIEAANAGRDDVTSYFSSISLTGALANIETAWLDSAAGAASIVGNAANNYLVGNNYSNQIIGGAGNDTILGGAGLDFLEGGLGNDSYRMFDDADNITEALNGGVDEVITNLISFDLSSSANVENLTFIYSGANAYGYGNALANVITGNDGNDWLSGYGGNDTLIGNLGNDTLKGGLGADSMTGGGGNDEYYVDAAGDKVIELANGGTDIIFSNISFSLLNSANVENLELSSTAISATGNALSNVITGNSTSNIIDGGAGNDTLIGGEGLDTLTGGAGADTFVFDLGNFNTGADTVKDFAFGVDKIGLIGFGGLFTGAAGSLNADYFVLNSAGEANDYFIYNKGTGNLYYDSDGNTPYGAGQIQIAHFNPGTTLSSVSFFDAS